MSYSLDDINRIEFGTAPFGRRGYAKPEVDRFIERIAKTLADDDNLTAAEVHHVMFGKPLIGKRGYDELQVNSFLDFIEDQLANRTGHSSPLPAARTHTDATAPRA